MAALLSSSRRNLNKDTKVDVWLDMNGMSEYKPALCRFFGYVSNVASCSLDRFAILLEKGCKLTPESKDFRKLVSLREELIASGLASAPTRFDKHPYVLKKRIYGTFGDVSGDFIVFCKLSGKDTFVACAFVAGHFKNAGLDYSDQIYMYDFGSFESYDSEKLVRLMKNTIGSEWVTMDSLDLKKLKLVGNMVISSSDDRIEPFDFIRDGKVFKTPKISKGMMPQPEIYVFGRSGGGSKTRSEAITMTEANFAQQEGNLATQTVGNRNLENFDHCTVLCDIPDNGNEYSTVKVIVYGESWMSDDLLETGGHATAIGRTKMLSNEHVFYALALDGGKREGEVTVAKLCEEDEDDMQRLKDGEVTVKELAVRWYEKEKHFDWQLKKSIPFCIVAAHWTGGHLGAQYDIQPVKNYRKPTSASLILEGDGYGKFVNWTGWNGWNGWNGVAQRDAVVVDFAAEKRVRRFSKILRKFETSPSYDPTEEKFVVYASLFEAESRYVAEDGGDTEEMKIAPLTAYEHSKRPSAFVLTLSADGTRSFGATLPGMSGATVRTFQGDKGVSLHETGDPEEGNGCIPFWDPVMSNIQSDADQPGELFTDSVANRLVQAGRVCCIVYGKHYRKLVVIVDFIDRNRVMVDGVEGRLSDLKRQSFPLRWLQCTKFRLNVKRDVAPEPLLEAVEASNVVELYKASPARTQTRVHQK